MNSFELYNPTKVIFGVDSYSKIDSEIPREARVLMTYGAGSIKNNGVYDAVMKQLGNRVVFEFGDIEPNPSLQTLEKALSLMKSESIDYLLAVGGGSVIDGTKFLAGAIFYQGDPWDILKKGIRINKALPIATVLTLPATGSENNSGAVITNKLTNEKLGMGGPALFPIVSFLNPEVVKSIPRRQLVNGLMDSFTHVLEQYLTYPINAMVQDGYSESLLKSIVKLAPRLINEPYNEVNAGNFMWICSMALNGQLGKGVPTDWSTHIIGHELTALYNIDHAVTLAIVFPNLWKNQFENKKEKLAQYAENVWNIQEGSIDEKAKMAIKCTEDFISSLQIDVRLSSYSLEYKRAANIIKENLKSRGQTRLGEKGTITPEVAERIIELCY